jgi:hypothetical protein
MAKPNAWSQLEVELIVNDYIEMLVAEHSGVAYSKTDHRLKLIAKLDNRSASSIEMKHRNISFALNELGFRYVKGYKPLANVQKSVYQVAFKFVERHPELRLATQPNTTGEPQESNPLVVFESFELAASKIKLCQGKSRQLGVSSDSEMLEHAKQLVYSFEICRLRTASQIGLSERISFVADKGFQILSYTEDGTELQVLVKVLSNDHLCPFQVTADEYFSSKLLDATYRMFVVFWVDSFPFAVLCTGVLDKYLKLRPHVYTAHF